MAGGATIARRPAAGRRHPWGRAGRLWGARTVYGLVLGVVLIMACHAPLPAQTRSPLRVMLPRGSGPP
jgi:hypothetical protein